MLARLLVHWLIVGCVTSLVACPNAMAQSPKPKRAKPPTLDSKQWDGVFFDDVAAQLVGKLPDSNSAAAANVAVAEAGPGKSAQSATSDDANAALAWNSIISPTSLEDLIKGSKLRLSKIVTSPASFTGGGFKAARTEFSLLGLLFAVVEEYSDDSVRWKRSASLARERMARAADNTKSGTTQSFKEAEQRMLDLDDLLNGSQLAGSAKTEADWSTLIDRTQVMKLLAWANDDYVSKISANEAEFAEKQDELKRYAELISVLGKTSIHEDMPDGTDEDYIGFANEMILQAQNIGQAVENKNAEQARLAAGRVSQSCQDCHDNFR